MHSRYAWSAPDRNTRKESNSERGSSGIFLPRTVLLFLFLESVGKFDLAITSEIEAGNREQQFAAFLCGQLSLACSAFSLFNPVNTFVLPARWQRKINYTWSIFFAASTRDGKAPLRTQAKIIHSGKTLRANAFGIEIIPEETGCRSNSSDCYSL